MLNRTINMSYPKEIRINEHRSPTDDSIRIYNEFRDKALQSILDMGRESMSIDQIQWVVTEFPEIRGIKLYLTFFVNGQKCHEEISFNKINLFGSLEEQCELIHNRVFERVTAAISREISKELFINMSREISKLIK